MSNSRRAEWRGILFISPVVLCAGIWVQVGVDGSGSNAWAWPPEANRSRAIVPALVWADWSRTVYDREHIPYFALHPPVYYSQPVGRPYGWSPFAYPGWVQTPMVAPPRPMVIQNPYVVGFGAGAKGEPFGSRGAEPAYSAAHGAGTPQPVRIKNPYVPAGAAEGIRSGSTKDARNANDGISSTAAVQPRRIRNPHLPE
mgnify:CR=1 FL=1